MTTLTLKDKERMALIALATSTFDAHILQRAYALLWLDEGEAVQDIAERLQVSRQTVYNWVERFHARAGDSPEAQLADAERSGRPCTAQGIIDPLIEAVVDRSPREWHYPSTIWTAPLLVRYLGEHYQLEVSTQSVHLAIARLKIRWKRPRHYLALRPFTWQQSKGGLNAGFLGLVQK